MDYQKNVQSLHFQAGRKTSVDFALSFSEQAAQRVDCALLHHHRD